MEQKHQELKIQNVSPSLLKAAEYNPRRMTVKQEADLSESLKKFGCVDPIIVNRHKGRENIVIGGHQRLKIARKLGYKEVPVAYVDLSADREKELNLRLNKNTGEWDYELLKEFDISLLMDVGFDEDDLSAVWDENLETEDDGFDAEKELDKIKDTEIRPGDLFQLGEHRLICGDSTDPSVIERLMGREKAAMAYCDPPFNIGLDYSKGLGGKKNYGGKVDDNKQIGEYREFLAKSISMAIKCGRDDLHVFYYCDQRHIGLLQEIYEKLGIGNKRVCLWVKNGINPTPQVAFNKCYEPCVYGTIGRPYLSKTKNLNEILNKDIEAGNRTADGILDALDIWLAKRIAGQEYEHPTEKPPTLHEKALRRCSKVNDLVLDLFGGSGSTLVACEQLKRKCYTAEVSPIFCQLIINRYEKYANEKAKKLN